MRSFIRLTAACLLGAATNNAAAAFPLHDGWVGNTAPANRVGFGRFKRIFDGGSTTAKRRRCSSYSKSRPTTDIVIASRNEQDDNDLQSHTSSSMVSSPERYAEQLGMTVTQVRRLQKEHEAASQALQQQVMGTSCSLDGPTKHRLICEHRYRYGKHPFVCRTCWCYIPICLCQDAARSPRIQLPRSVKQVILWTHHREWSSISNSGSLLPLLLKDTKLLMKGLPQHDEEFQHILHKSNDHVVVLWPDNDTSPKKKPQESTIEETTQYDRTTWHDLQTILSDDTNQVTLVALEGTWRTARRMASKLPPTVQRVSLPPHVLFWNQPPPGRDNDDGDDDNSDNDSKANLIRQSLLRPLRRQEGGSQHNLCTAEAVTAALVSLGLPESHGSRILDLVNTKVDQTRRYRGKQ